MRLECLLSAHQFQHELIFHPFVQAKNILWAFYNDVKITPVELTDHKKWTTIKRDYILIIINKHMFVGLYYL